MLIETVNGTFTFQTKLIHAETFTVSKPLVSSQTVDPHSTKLALNTKLTLLLLFTLQVGFTFGQNPRYLMLELGGAGGLGSVNFESVFSQKEQLRLSFRTGVSIMPIDKNNGAALIFPQMIHGTYGQGAHQADVGIGLAPSITTNLGGAFVRMPLSLGYRLEPLEKHYYFRVAYTPLLSFLFDLQWQHWAGVTFAYQLNRKKD